jgi:hypothetical protein
MPLCEIAAFFLPHWHADPRTDLWHGKGWTQWELVKAAKPRYEGHRQPVVPAWGYPEDSDTHELAREIDLAATHGVSSFLFHWYYFEDGPFLNASLDRGFLEAPNADSIKFGLMWDNRDYLNVHPASAAGTPQVLASGKISPDAFEKMSRLIVDKYFSHPGYLRVDGCPYFGIYDLVSFVESFGNPQAAFEALEALQLKAAAAGLPGLHIAGLLWRLKDKQRWAPYGGPAELIGALHLDSVSPASWLDHYEGTADTFPRGSYAKAAAANFHAWDQEARHWRTAYVPNITVGLDATPLCCPTDRFERRDYPWLPVLEGNTPAAFRSAAEHAKVFLSKPEAKVQMVTVSSWNDWTQGAALLPDGAHGQCYLEMIKRVFAR